MKFGDIFGKVVFLLFVYFVQSEKWNPSSFSNTPIWEASFGATPTLSAADQTLRINNPNSKSGVALKKEPTYFVLASQIVRPGLNYRIAVHILRGRRPIKVRAAIIRNGLEVTHVLQLCKTNVPALLQMKIPSNSIPGVYKLRLEGNISGVLGGTIFFNETLLHFSQRSMSIMIQTNLPFYKQGQTVHFRAFIVTADLDVYSDPVDIFILEPSGHIAKRWLSRQTNKGAINLAYDLPDQVIPGTWKIRIQAQAQVKEHEIIVEEHYQTRFEVNVTMPLYALETDNFIIGTVEANYTSGAPVVGSLALEVYIHSPEDTKNRFDSPPVIQETELFTGIFEFRYTLIELERLHSSYQLEGMEVTVKATIHDKLYKLKYDGYASTLIYNNGVWLRFLGPQPQIFKPTAPFRTFIVASTQNNSPLPNYRIKQSKLQVHPQIVYQSEKTQTLDPRTPRMLPHQPGLWELEIDLMSEPSVDKEELHNIKYLKLDAEYKDNSGHPAYSNLVVVTQLSPNYHHLSLSSSTKKPKVGEYIIFHVRADFYLLEFSYVIMSKGLIITMGTESIASSIRTFAITLTPAMVPSATIVIYYIGINGDVIADSLTFPVSGITKDSFNITLNPHKSKSEDHLEITVFGEPGTYIGLSALDWDLYLMQSDSELNSAMIANEMNRFDDEINGTFQHKWTSPEGFPDEPVHLPSTSFGIDANRTLDFVGLLIYTDANMTRYQDMCDVSKELFTCLTGSCYASHRRCDGFQDCDDGSDETNCEPDDFNDIKTWKIYRRNHIQRLFDSSWLWKDVNIGPKGYTTLNVSVPNTPSHWMISAFSINRKSGIGLLREPLQYLGTRTFYMTLEMPSECFQGEQLGLRVTLFNYSPNEIQAAVLLANSDYYNFVNVEAVGTVLSYNPRTTREEKQHLVLIQPYDSIVIHLPITPTKLGDINVTVMALTKTGKYSLMKKLHVKAEGIPQFLHTSVMLDLSNRAYLIKYLDINMTDAPVIPHQKDHYFVFGSNKVYLSIFGDVVGPAFPYMPVTSDNILKLPSGCGEQNMFTFAYNFLTLKYLRISNQRNKDIEKTAFRYLSLAYARQLSYRTSDGAFKAFRWNSQPSVWLTAFCVKYFYEANFSEWEYSLFIDLKVINQAVKWLLKHQARYGAFMETSLHPYDRKMNMTSESNNSKDPAHLRNVSLTAHVLISLLALRDLPGDVGAQATRSRNLAINYLERMLKIIGNFKDPYELCIVSYALTLAGSSSRELAYNLLSAHRKDIDGMIFWGQDEVPAPRYNIMNNKPFVQARLPYHKDSRNIEATAYALLTYVERQALLQEPIVEWLNFQRLNDGGWASTQDSLIAYQSLLAYSERSSGLREQTDISITIETSAAPSFEKIVQIENENLAELQKIDFPNPWGTIRLLARGSGIAIVQLNVQYNIDKPELQIMPPAESFSIQMKAKFSGRNSSHIKIESCQRWTYLNESETSGMAVLEVGIPTGYYIQQQTLNAYVVSQKVRNLRRADFTGNKIICYFDFLDSNDICVKFQVERWYPVANLSRFVGIKVYDYYSPERFNETLYEMPALHELNICAVCGSYQCPHCPIFSSGNRMQLQVVISILCTLCIVVRTLVVL